MSGRRAAQSARVTGRVAARRVIRLAAGLLECMALADDAEPILDQTAPQVSQEWSRNDLRMAQDTEIDLRLV